MCAYGTRIHACILQYPSRMSVYAMRMAKPNVAFWLQIHMNLIKHAHDKKMFDI